MMFKNAMRIILTVCILILIACVAILFVTKQSAMNGNKVQKHSIISSSVKKARDTYIITNGSTGIEYGTPFAAIPDYILAFQAVNPGTYLIGLNGSFESVTNDPTTNISQAQVFQTKFVVNYQSNNCVYLDEGSRSATILSDGKIVNICSVITILLVRGDTIGVLVTPDVFWNSAKAILTWRIC